MSQTGTPTEFLQLGITEPDDTLNVLVDLNGQWRKIDTGVKNVDIKATTNAGNITTLQGAVHDNTENITNILDTNVNQQNSIDTLQTKVAALEEDDTSYGSRITAVENGVQENSELINDLEVDLSGVKLNVGTVPSGSNLQAEVDGLDTRVTALENSGSVASVEARVTALEGSVGTVPAGETVEGQISGLDTDVTALQGQVNSGNIPFRFSVDGGGNYGYLKADDSFVPFSSGDSRWHEMDANLYLINERQSFIVPYGGYRDSTSPNYGKVHDLIHNADYTLPVHNQIHTYGNVILVENSNAYLLANGTLNIINDNVVAVLFNASTRRTIYLTRNNNTFNYNVVDVDGNNVGLTVNHTILGTPTSLIGFYSFGYDSMLRYKYNGVSNWVEFFPETGTVDTGTSTTPTNQMYDTIIVDGKVKKAFYFDTLNNTTKTIDDVTNNSVVVQDLSNHYFLYYTDNKYYYYI